MESAQNYLAERVQQLELSKEVSEFSYVYWSNKAFEYMKKLNMSSEEIQEECKKALKAGAKC